MFSCEFCKVPKNTFYAEHLWTTASALCRFSFQVCSFTYSSFKTDCPLLLMSVKFYIFTKSVTITYSYWTNSSDHITERQVLNCFLEESICVGVSFEWNCSHEGLQHTPDTPKHVFSCEICENFKSIYFEEHLEGTDSVTRITLRSI